MSNDANIGIEQPTHAPGVLTRYLDGRPALVRGMYIVVFILSVAYCVFHVVRFASITTDENVYINSPKGVLITSIVPGGASDKAGLKVGDVIVEVDGSPVKNTMDAMVSIVTGSKGKKLVYTVLRGGTRIPVTIVLADYGITLFTFTLILTGALFLSLSAYVILRRPGMPVARLFGWATLLTGVFMLVNFHYPEWYYRSFLDTLNPFVLLLTWALGFASMYHLFLFFPVPRRLGTLPQWFFFVLYGIPAAVSVLIFAGAFPAKPPSMILTTMLTAPACEYLIRGRFKLSPNPAYDPLARNLRIAGMLGVLIVIGWLFVRDASSWQSVFFLQLAVPGLLLATIIRHRVFGLYVIIRRASMYRVATIVWNVVIAAAFVLMVFALSTITWRLPVLHFSGTSVQIVQHTSFPPEQRQVIERRVMLIASLLIVALLWRVRSQGARFIDRKFHRGDYDYRRALNEFSQLSTRFADVPALAEAVVRDLPSIMHLGGAAFAQRVDDRFLLRAMEGLRIDRDDEAALRADAPWLTDLAGAEAVDNIDARAIFGSAGVEVVTPVLLDKRVEALILLGEKLSGTNYTKDDIELLDSLAINVGDALLTMQFYEGSKEQERMRRELEIARRIQLGTLPDELPEFPGIDVAAASTPATEVGGDFYDFLGHHDAITFLVGDVSGKGTSAALYLSRIQGIIRAIDSYGPSLWELFVRLNGQAFDSSERQAYLTLSALRLDMIRGSVAFLRAGHLPLLHFRASDSEVLQRRPKGIGIGLDSSMFGENLEQESWPMESGDIFLLVTDGITEAASPGGEQYGVDRLAALLKSSSDLSAEDIKQSVFSAVAKFSKSSEQLDDMTVLVVKLR